MSRTEEAPRFTKAEVRVLADPARNAVNKTVVLDKAAQVGQLAQFFPEVGSGRNSGTAELWKAQVFILLTDDKGNTYKVTTNYKQWNCPGHGDRELKHPDRFEKFVEEITKE
jgi:hypothetical protein